MARDNRLYLDFKHSYEDFNNLLEGAVYGLIDLDEFFNEAGFIKLRFFDTKTLLKNNAKFEDICDGFFLISFNNFTFIGREVLEENFVMCFIKGTDAYINALKSRTYKELIYSNTVERLISILSDKTLPMHNVMKNKFNHSIALSGNKKLVGFVLPWQKVFN